MGSVTKTPTMAETTAMVETRTAGAKGKGLFAKVDIPKGTRILAEAPFITICMDMPQQFTRFVEIANSMPDKITELDELTYNPALLNEQEPGNIITQIRNEEGRIADPNDDMVRRYAVFRTNCVDMHSKPRQASVPGLEAAASQSEPQYSNGGLCLMYSRMNHSCLPNAYFSWNEALGREVVHAARDISADEEILANYLGADAVYMTHAQRNKRLRRWWGFDCDCPACVEDTDALREELAWLEARLVEIDDAQGRVAPEASSSSAPAVSMETDEGGYQTALELVGTLEDAGLGGYSLCEAYKECSHHSMLTGDRDSAIEHAKMNLKTQKDTFGDDAVDSMWIPEMIRTEALERYEEEERDG